MSIPGPTPAVCRGYALPSSGPAPTPSPGNALKANRPCAPNVERNPGVERNSHERFGGTFDTTPGPGRLAAGLPKRNGKPQCTGVVSPSNYPTPRSTTSSPTPRLTGLLLVRPEG